MEDYLQNMLCMFSELQAAGEAKIPEEDVVTQMLMNLPQSWNTLITVLENLKDIARSYLLKQAVDDLVYELLIRPSSLAQRRLLDSVCMEGENVPQFFFRARIG